MHWLVNRAIEEFLSDTYGDALWGEGARHGDETTPSVTLKNSSALSQAAHRSGRQPVELCEDLGAWLARKEPIRRLLRFAGRHFGEFVLRLGELPGRVEMVIPDLPVPEVRITSAQPDRLVIVLNSDDESWAALMAGMLRAMADDYGVLALILCEGPEISVHVPDSSFSAGREFSLGAVYASSRSVT